MFAYHVISKGRLVDPLFQNTLASGCPMPGSDRSKCWMLVEFVPSLCRYGINRSVPGLNSGGSVGGVGVSVTYVSSEMGLTRIGPCAPVQPVNPLGPVEPVDPVMPVDPESAILKMFSATAGDPGYTGPSEGATLISSM